MNIFLPIRKCAINIYEIVVDLPPFFIILTCEIETGAGKRPKTSSSFSILAEKSEINPLTIFYIIFMMYQRSISSAAFQGSVKIFMDPDFDLITRILPYFQRIQIYIQIWGEIRQMQNKMVWFVDSNMI